MKQAILFLAGMPLLASSCAGPATIAEALHANSVVFAGSPVSIVQENWTRIVEFAVDRVLWGLPETSRRVTVKTTEGSWGTGLAHFVIAVRDSENGLRIDNCWGLVLEAHHPWAREFVTLVESRARASLLIDTYKAGVELTLLGKNERFFGTTNTQGVFKWEDLPAGRYRIATGKGFRPQKSEVTIAPGARARLYFPISGTSRIRGRVFDHQGLPAANLVGLQLVEWDSASGKYGIHHRSFQTDEEGRFDVKNVTPGDYHLGCNLEHGSDPECPFRRMAYPGVPDAAQAAIIRVEPDQEQESVFHLPPFDRKRRVSILVTTPGGAPLPNVLVRKHSNHDRPRALDFAFTGADGRVEFDLWCSERYRIRAMLPGQSAPAEFDAFDIPPGEGPVTIGLRLDPKGKTGPAQAW